MSDTTAIEWCDSTFNPWMGCTRVSPACDDCYAARSTPARTLGVVWGTGEQRRRTSAANWKQPLQWERNHANFMTLYGRRRRVFCASLADVFDNEVPAEWRADLFRLIAQTPHLDWLLLTKRIGNVAGMLGDYRTAPLLPNIWLGITVVNQAEADRDVPKLLRVQARVRFLSVEPMLGPIDLRSHLAGHCPEHDFASGFCLDRRHAGVQHLRWVICGGESGPNARPMHPDWARSLRDQCAAAGVAFLFKQWGEWVEHDGHKPTRAIRMDTDVGETLAARCDGFISHVGEFVRDMDDATTDDPYRGMVRIGKKAAGRLLDGRTHDEWPA